MTLLLFKSIKTTKVKKVITLMIIRYLLYAALLLIFAYVDSQRGEIKRNKSVHNNLRVMIKKNVRSEILCE